MDDFDIYADLSSFNTEETECNEEKYNETKEKYKYLEQELSELKTKLEQLQGEKKKLETNFSSLIKTAKAEISRKDRSISELRTQLDNVTFRRNQRSRNYNQNILPRVENYKIPIVKPCDYPPPLMSTHTNNGLEIQGLSNYQFNCPPPLHAVFNQDNCPPPLHAAFNQEKYEYQIINKPLFTYPPPPIKSESGNDYKLCQQNDINSTTEVNVEVDNTLTKSHFKSKRDFNESDNSEDEIVNKSEYRSTVYGERLRKRLMAEKEAEKINKEEIKETKLEKLNDLKKKKTFEEKEMDKNKKEELKNLKEKSNIKELKVYESKEKENRRKIEEKYMKNLEKKSNIKELEVYKSKEKEHRRKIEETNKDPRDRVKELEVYESKEKENRRKIEETNKDPRDRVKELEVYESKEKENRRKIEETNKDPRDRVKELEVYKSKEKENRRKIEETNKDPHDRVKELEVYKSKEQENRRKIEETNKDPRDRVKELEVYESKEKENRRKIEENSMKNLEEKSNIIKELKVYESKEKENRRKIEEKSMKSLEEKSNIKELEVYENKEKENRKKIEEKSMKNLEKTSNIKELEVYKSKEKENRRKIEETNKDPRDRVNNKENLSLVNFHSKEDVLPISKEITTTNIILTEKMEYFCSKEELPKDIQKDKIETYLSKNYKNCSIKNSQKEDKANYKEKSYEHSSRQDRYKESEKYNHHKSKRKHKSKDRDKLNKSKEKKKKKHKDSKLELTQSPEKIKRYNKDKHDKKKYHETKKHKKHKNKKRRSRSNSEENTSPKCKRRKIEIDPFIEVNKSSNNFIEKIESHTSQANSYFQSKDRKSAQFQHKNVKYEVERCAKITYKNNYSEREIMSLKCKKNEYEADRQSKSGKTNSTVKEINANSQKGTEIKRPCNFELIKHEQQKNQILFNKQEDKNSNNSYAEQNTKRQIIEDLEEGEIIDSANESNENIYTDMSIQTEINAKNIVEKEREVEKRNDDHEVLPNQMNDESNLFNITDIKRKSEKTIMDKANDTLSIKEVKIEKMNKIESHIQDSLPNESEKIIPDNVNNISEMKEVKVQEVNKIDQKINNEEAVDNSFKECKTIAMPLEKEKKSSFSNIEEKKKCNSDSSMNKIEEESLKEPTNNINLKEQQSISLIINDKEEKQNDSSISFQVIAEKSEVNVEPIKEEFVSITVEQEQPDNSNTVLETINKDDPIECEINIIQEKQEIFPFTMEKKLDVEEGTSYEKVEENTLAEFIINVGSTKEEINNTVKENQVTTPVINEMLKQAKRKSFSEKNAKKLRSSENVKDKESEQIKFKQPMACAESLGQNEKKFSHGYNILTKKCFNPLVHTEKPLNKKAVEGELVIRKETRIVKPRLSKNIIIVNRPRRRVVQLSDSPPVLVVDRTGINKIQ